MQNLEYSQKRNDEACLRVFWYHYFASRRKVRSTTRQSVFLQFVLIMAVCSDENIPDCLESRGSYCMKSKQVEVCIGSGNYIILVHYMNFRSSRTSVVYDYSFFVCEHMRTAFT